MNGIDIPEEINVHKQIWGRMQRRLYMVAERREIKTKNIGVPYAIQESMNLDIVLVEVI